MQAKYFTYIHMIDPLVKRMGQRGRGVILDIVGAGGKVANPTHLAGGAANAALMLESAGLAARQLRHGRQHRHGRCDHADGRLRPFY